MIYFWCVIFREVKSLSKKNQIQKNFFFFEVDDFLEKTFHFISKNHADFSPHKKKIFFFLSHHLRF
jgi:hypothetical protein